MPIFDNEGMSNWLTLFHLTYIHICIFYLPTQMNSKLPHRPKIIEPFVANEFQLLSCIKQMNEFFRFLMKNIFNNNNIDCGKFHVFRKQINGFLKYKRWQCLFAEKQMSNLQSNSVWLLIEAYAIDLPPSISCSIF